MSLFTMHYGGAVRKPQTKEIGGKQAIEFQLMKKNYAPQGQEATFSWIRITVFDVKAWQIEQCQEGKVVSGHGEFTLRSFVDKDGNKRQSAEVRSTSLQLDAPRTAEPTATGPMIAAGVPAHTAPATSPKPRVPARAVEDPTDPNLPPF